MFARSSSLQYVSVRQFKYRIYIYKVYLIKNTKCSELISENEMARLTEEMVIARSKQSDLSAIKKLNCWWVIMYLFIVIESPLAQQLPIRDPCGTLRSLLTWLMVLETEKNLRSYLCWKWGPYISFWSIYMLNMLKQVMPCILKYCVQVLILE